MVGGGARGGGAAGEAIRGNGILWNLLESSGIF